jgi:antitoxin component of MazEF toxin-antitoxin module
MKTRRAKPKSSLKVRNLKRARVSGGSPSRAHANGNGIGELSRKAKRRASLDELVSRITPENRHEEIDFGPPVGREVW